MVRKYIILVLILLLLLIAISDKQELFINNEKKWECYRLGDIIKYWNNMKYQKKSWEYSDSISSKFPNSIGHKYLKRNKVKKQNLTLLFKIIDEEIINQNIPKNNISLHLRLGDVVNYENKFTHPYLTKLDRLDSILKKFKNKEIHVFYGAHFIQKGNNLDENLKYLETIKDILKKHNIKYKMRNSGNPDLDFLNMCHSNMFIQSGGGFSKLIADYVKSKNKNVIR
jgi:hypothetical protein